LLVGVKEKGCEGDVFVLNNPEEIGEEEINGDKQRNIKDVNTTLVWLTQE
jgi:hypothetical protein